MRTFLLLLLATFAIAADQRPLVLSPTAGNPIQIPAGSRVSLPTASGGFYATIDPGVQTATRVFTLPVTAGGDTFDVLGTAQTFSAAKTFGAGLTAKTPIVFQDATDATKQWSLSLSGMTTAKTLTIASAQTTSQTLNFPNITATDTLATLGLSQTFSAVTAFSNATTSGSSTTGTVIIGNGTAATTIGLGGGNGNFGGGVNANGVSTFTTAGGSGSTITINTGTAGTQAGFALSDNGTAKWNVIKQTTNAFLIFDIANSVSSMTITPGSASAGSVRFGYTTSSSSSLTGGVIIGDGSTTATSVGIGGGNVYAGSGANFAHTGNSLSTVVINATTAGTNAGLTFQDGGTAEFSIYKVSSNVLSIFDAVNSVDQMVFTTGTAATGSIHAQLTKDASAIGTASVIVDGGATFAKTVGLGSVSAPGSPFMGQVWNDSTRQGLMTFAGNSTANGLKQFLSGTFFTSTGGATSANTTTPTTIIGSGIGTSTIPASWFTVGKVVRIKVAGTVSDAATVTLRFDLVYNGTTWSTQAISLGNSYSSAPFSGEFLLRCDIAGGSSQLSGFGSVVISDGTNVKNFTLTGTSTLVGIGTAQAVDIRATWGTASASNTITGTIATMEVLN